MYWFNKKSSKISKFLYLFIFFMLTVSCKKYDTKWKEIEQIFSEIESLENENFSKLRFELSDTNLSDSLTFKFVVRDQFNEDWVFKYGKFQVDGAILQYRIYQLLGINTPEIHKLSLSVNGNIINGTLQKFQNNLGPLTRFRNKELPPDALFDIAQNHILSWATLNHHVHQGQFLVLGPHKSAPERIVRIDNTVEWYLLNQDELHHDYKTPWLWDIGGLGYGMFWRTYFRKDIDLQLTKLHRFARLFNSMPDDMYAQFFNEGIANDYEKFSNISYKYIEKYAPDLMAKSNKESFLSEIIKRKNRLSDDFSVFYRNMAKLRGEQFNPDKSDLDEELSVILSVLKKKKEWLLERKKILSTHVLPPQKNIELAASLKAHDILFNTYMFPVFASKNDIYNRFQKADSELQELQKKPELNKLEKMAINAAHKEISTAIKNNFHLLPPNLLRIRAINANKNIKALIE